MNSIGKTRNVRVRSKSKEKLPSGFEVLPIESPENERMWPADDDDDEQQNKGSAILFSRLRFGDAISIPNFPTRASSDLEAKRQNEEAQLSRKAKDGKADNVDSYRY